jgi:hypothetical protein
VNMPLAVQGRHTASVHNLAVPPQLGGASTATHAPGCLHFVSFCRPYSQPRHVVARSLSSVLLSRHRMSNPPQQPSSKSAARAARRVKQAAGADQWDLLSSVLRALPVDQQARALRAAADHLMSTPKGPSKAALPARPAPAAAPPAAPGANSTRRRGCRGQGGKRNSRAAAAAAPAAAASAEQPAPPDQGGEQPLMEGVEVPVNAAAEPLAAAQSGARLQFNSLLAAQRQRRLTDPDMGFVAAVAAPPIPAAAPAASSRAAEPRSGLRPGFLRQQPPRKRHHQQQPNGTPSGAPPASQL